MQVFNNDLLLHLESQSLQDGGNDSFEQDFSNNFDNIHPTADVSTASRHNVPARAE
jgi:hypothetical protein